jgi:hypothetical protein
MYKKESNDSFRFYLCPLGRTEKLFAADHLMPLIFRLALRYRSGYIPIRLRTLEKMSCSRSAP